MEAMVLDRGAPGAAAMAGAPWRAFTTAGAPNQAPKAAPPQPHVLWVGDEAMFGRSISQYLIDNHLSVTSVLNIDAMLRVLKTAVVDVVVLALNGGALFAPRLREESPVPIIMLNIQREEVDRIIALELGADDCLTAPFSPRELLARVRAILRRRRIDSRQPKSHGVRAYRFDGWELNVNTRRLHSPGRQEIVLSNGEFNLLVALLAAGERILSRMQLLELSRLHDDEVYDRAVDVQIMRLRRKLEAHGNGARCLETVRGAGYRIGVPVEPVF
ncbi:MAG TPA: winged helix-turn-helix domain-containing protein [Burkholderiaceae bacterium]|nr:winged helix-turn-helix domain-containing protein [Burkholderiaceae bacterium]